MQGARHPYCNLVYALLRSIFNATILDYSTALHLALRNPRSDIRRRRYLEDVKINGVVPVANQTYITAGIGDMALKWSFAPLISPLTRFRRRRRRRYTFRSHG